MSSATFKKILEAEPLGIAANQKVGSLAAEPKWKDLIAFAKTANAGGATVDVIIEHSPNGVDWFTLATIPTLSGNDSDLVRITDSNLGNLRADVTVAGATADVSVDIYYNPH